MSTTVDMNGSSVALDSENSNVDKSIVESVWTEEKKVELLILVCVVDECERSVLTVVYEVEECEWSVVKWVVPVTLEYGVDECEWSVVMWLVPVTLVE